MSVANWKQESGSQGEHSAVYKRKLLRLRVAERLFESDVCRGRSEVRRAQFNLLYDQDTMT